MPDAEIIFVAKGTKDVNGDDYYFIVPNLPVLIDLSQAVLFFRPDEDERGNFSLEVKIKRYQRGSSRKRTNQKRTNQKRPATVGS